MAIPRLTDLLKLPKEEDEESTFKEIEEGTHFRGHNLWLLVLSMAIACVGLNINSPAAVIGAMLISPLMGPIVGVSFGFSIGNRHLLRLGFRNWVVMIAVALTSSTLYFLLSPFHEETSQLEAFKNATVFDCMLALFGGFAWFLGIIRKEAIKVIAGVAVSTACIPPLCTAGYGIANGNWEYFWGGFYFYIINCFFIGVGTWVLSVVLGYQRFYLKSQSTRNRTTSALITLLSAIFLIPSLLITKKKWENENLQQRSRDYVEQIKAANPALAIISYEPYQKGTKKFLRITLLNDSTTVNKQRLTEHDDLVKDIQLIWQYAPGAASKNSEIQHLQQQISAMQNDLKLLKATGPAKRP